MTDAETLEPAEAPKKTRKALAPPSPKEGLSARAEAARERVEALQRERDEATLKGDTFDHAKLRDAEDELEAIGSAQSEIVRQERAANAVAERERIAAERKQALAHDAERRAAIEEAEALARALADALNRAEARRADTERALRSAGDRLPMMLQKTEHLDRLCRGLSAVLATVTGTVGGRLGEIKLHLTSAQAGDAWLEAEERASAHLAAAMETEK